MTSRKLVSVVLVLFLACEPSLQSKDTAFTKLACAGERMRIQCDGRTIVNVKNAFLQKQVLCGFDQQLTAHGQVCDKNVKSTVVGLCEGKNLCEFDVGVGNFSNVQCGLVNTMLFVDATCQWQHNMQEGLERTEDNFWSFGDPDPNNAFLGMLLILSYSISWVWVSTFIVGYFFFRDKQGVVEESQVGPLPKPLRRQGVIAVVSSVVYSVIVTACWATYKRVEFGPQKQEYRGRVFALWFFTAFILFVFIAVDRPVPVVQGHIVIHLSPHSSGLGKGLLSDESIRGLLVPENAIHFDQDVADSLWRKFAKIMMTGMLESDDVSVVFPDVDPRLGVREQAVRKKAIDWAREEYKNQRRGALFPEPKIEDGWSNSNDVEVAKQAILVSYLTGIKAITLEFKTNEDDAKATQPKQPWQRFEIFYNSIFHSVSAHEKAKVVTYSLMAGILILYSVHLLGLN